MTLQETTKVDSKHSRYKYKHKIKGVWVPIEVIALSPERALEKAWAEVKQTYKELKNKQL